MSKSISSTFSKLLNTVGTVADATSKIVDNTASGLDMLDMFITTAKQKQEARIAADMSTFYDDLQAETALENAMKQTALDQELNSNSELKKNYNSEFSKLESVLTKVKSKYQTVE